RFAHKIEGDRIVFQVQGYGHGVGMCQYGADGMGEAGQDYRAILKHYYRGTEVTSLR
ncbi:MAG TPA: stage II sporulation protein D, partial [Firmicutes bacterium]|nr:stage II sporulation protein D [Bacillota bacterium]